MKLGRHVDLLSKCKFCTLDGTLDGTLEQKQRFACADEDCERARSQSQNSLDFCASCRKNSFDFCGWHSHGMQISGLLVAKRILVLEASFEDTLRDFIADSLSSMNIVVAFYDSKKVWPNKLNIPLF